MDSSENASMAGSGKPTPRELRAARRRAHEEQKNKSAASRAGKGGKGGKGGMMGKGGGSQGSSADDRRRR